MGWVIIHRSDIRTIDADSWCEASKLSIWIQTTGKNNMRHVLCLAIALILGNSTFLVIADEMIAITRTVTLKREA